MTRQTRSRALTALFIVFALVLSLLPAGALAAESAPAPSVTFTFTDEGVTAQGETSGYKIEGTALTINAAGVYAVTGTCQEGSIKIKKETTGVTLILDGLTLSSSTTAPLSCNKATETTLYLRGTNTLTDLEDPTDEDSADEAVADAFEGAAIKVKAGASLTITGTGTLNADGSACKNGVKGGATSTITVESGTLNITAANNGLAADGEVILHGGDLTIAAGNEAIKAEPDEDDADSAGTVTITGGSVTVTQADDAIHATNTLTITGGTLDLTCSDDAIHSEYDVILGTAGSADGPAITVRSCYEGVEGARIFLNSGSASINASDDGVNAATDQAVSEISITVNGGTWLINAKGDGLDAGGDSRNNSGGNILLNGGVVEAVCTGSGNGALDFDGACTANGGTLLAVGSDMAQTPTTGLSVVFGGGMGGGQMGGQMGQPGQMNTQPGQMGGMNGQRSGQQPGPMNTAGQTGSISGVLTVKDSSGNTLYTSQQAMSGSYAIFVSPDLVSGQTYTLNDTLTATAGTGMGNMSGQPGNQQTQPGNQQTQPGGQQTQPGSQQTQPAARETTPFTDVPSTSWYAPSVSYVYGKGIMNGMTDTQFGPNTALTRAMLVQMLYNLEGCPEQSGASGFQDVRSTSWYSDAVTWAKNEGIVSGYSAESFGPNDPVTRAQAATILRNYAASTGRDTTPGEARLFSDSDAVPAWAQSAMDWCVSEGILQGDGDALDPTGTATRAQIAAIFQRFLEAA